MTAPDRVEGVLDVGGKPAAFLREGPLDGRPLVVLAHGAGAPMTHPFMEGTAEGLVARGLAVMRFHFPYMERRARDGGRRPPDRPPVLLATWREALAVAREAAAGAPLVMAGKSLGGRMASMLLASGEETGARAAVYLGYPLHPPGKKDRLRDAHLPDVPVPQLFVQGSRDALCDLDLLRPVLARIGDTARLHVVEGGDHSLAVRRGKPLEGADEWLDVVAEFAR